MSLKGLIQSGHVPVHKYQLRVKGLPNITFIKVSGIEYELEVAEMPDRTVHTNGETKAIEFTAEVPLHHAAEQDAIESWFEDAQDPALPGYKRIATLICESVSVMFRPTVFQIVGVFPKKRKLPDMDMSNDSDMAVVEWTFAADEIMKLS